MTTPVRRHRLSSAQLTEIVWGRPGPEVIRALYAADVSRHRLLAAHALRRHAGPAENVVTALAVLDEAQRRDPAGTADVLRTGWLGTWAANLLDMPGRGAEAANRLGALAAVTALRAGLEADLMVGATAGQLHLPGLGTLSTALPDGSTVALRVRDGLAVQLAEGPLQLPAPAIHGRWSPIRTLNVAGFQLMIDDQDPYRDCFSMPLGAPLSDEEFGRWRRVIGEACALLAGFAPAVAEQMRLGVRVVVPLAPTPHGAEASVSCSDALGVIATTTPVDSMTFAVTLVHEWSHSVLNGLLGFVGLHHLEQPGFYFAPWRPDPRPLSGILHGTFAFLAVAETWQALRAADSGGKRAEFEFALRRRQLAEVMAYLPAAAGLSPQGRRFVAILKRRCAALFETPVRREADDDAVAAVAAQKAIWIRRHGGDSP
ncbi:hypothetical protein DMB66_04975 [Actinoplanes sp. ATCC 53533]|uniref:aKG-HExxH-type peptide beta-hydroxylase n=1 Tax=Actinoplanes sp. ATCC 53533 TaxID=1288362 RepID=UPI000F76C783|nr:HEXXH motif-containing putative peptide modification protein [Actinoplanes sp. ATCC 53533]RSM72733.1 hypothetical protein DMB66_04975 [Actinoplanes sp. ATCC 53533]